MHLYIVFFFQISGTIVISWNVESSESVIWAFRFWRDETNLGQGPKIEKSESMVFDHQEGGGHPKLNTYSDLQFLLNFLCALQFTQFVEKLYIGVV